MDEITECDLENRPFTLKTMMGKTIKTKKLSSLRQVHPLATWDWKMKRVYKDTVYLHVQPVMDSSIKVSRSQWLVGVILPVKKHIS